MLEKKRAPDLAKVYRGSLLKSKSMEDLVQSYYAKQMAKALDKQIIDPKIRIRLLSSKMRLVSDRLVSQATEFKKGPTDKWENPIQIEFTLLDQEDIKGAQEYLGQISGKLPLLTKEKKEGKKFKKKVQLLDEEPIKELLHTAESKCKTQEDWITYLRDLGFVFVSRQFIEDFKIPIKLREYENLSYMVRAVKIAKNPMADKYDHQLAVGFSMEKDSQYKKIVIYLYGKFLKKIPMDWKDKKQRTLQKPELLVFPTYMTEEERIKFSAEHRKRKDPKLEALPEKSKIYQRWEDHVKFR